MMSDGGGGFLLPSDEPYAKDHTAPVFRGGLIQTALSAKSMILCVDVTHPGSTILEKELAISFAEDPRQRSTKAIRFTQTPEVRMTVKLPAGAEVRRNKVIGGARGVGEITTVKRAEGKLFGR